MSRRIVRFLRGQHGVTMIELLVALAVFALFVLMIDAIFSSARTNARKTEIAADVQQNGRVAADRILRELHETNINQVLVNNGTPGASQIVFKSARLTQDNSVFCLYTRATSGLGYDSRCFTFSGGNVTPPPYTSPEPIVPRGTYTPLWRRYVGYYVFCPTVCPPDPMELHRVVGDLSTPDSALSLSVLAGGDTVAALIQSFDVAVSGSVVTVTLQAQGSEVVQGRAIPVQQILLPGQSMTRN